MNNLSNADLNAILAAADDVISAIADENEDVHPGDTPKMIALWDDLNDRHAPPEVVKAMASELLAVREAGKEPVAATMFKPVADLFAFKAPGCREWSFTDDAKGIPEMVRRGWPVREYVTLERFQKSYAAPQLHAVPDEREAFESFMVQRFGESIDQRRAKNGDNEYMAWDKAVAWTVWQHRAAIASSPQNQQQNIPEIIPADTRRMNWLCSMVVDVREPLAYGSHSVFWSQRVSDDDEPHRTTLREQIDAMIAAAPKPGGNNG